MRFSGLRALFAFALCCFASVQAVAEEDDNAPPYWASIRAERVNLRIGPNENYRVLWVYHRPDLPLRVVRKKDGWRLVRDPDGAQGWVVARFLSRERTAIVTGRSPADLREQPDAGAALRWRVAPGVVGRLGECEQGWCRLDIKGHAGWIRQDRLWGAGEP